MAGVLFIINGCKPSEKAAVFGIGPSGLLEIPGGTAEAGETLAQTAVREAGEELGIDPRTCALLETFIRAHEHRISIKNEIGAFTVFIVKVPSFEFDRPATAEMNRFTGVRIWGGLPLGKEVMRDRDVEIIQSGWNLIWRVMGDDNIPMWMP